MSVTQRHCKGIGCIGGRLIRQIEQYTYHVLDLLLVRAAVTNDRGFDARRRIFGDRQSRLRECADRSAARLSKYQRAGYVHLHEYFLNRRFLRRVLADHFSEFAENMQQALRQRDVFALNTTVNDAGAATAGGFNDAVAGDARAWIDAENPDQR